MQNNLQLHTPVNPGFDWNGTATFVMDCNILEYQLFSVKLHNIGTACSSTSLRFTLEQSGALYLMKVILYHLQKWIVTILQPSPKFTCIWQWFKYPCATTHHHSLAAISSLAMSACPLQGPCTAHTLCPLPTPLFALPPRPCLVP
jgi:hypothetical protein